MVLLALIALSIGSLLAGKASLLIGAVAAVIILTLGRRTLAAAWRSIWALWKGNTTPELRDALHGAVKIGLRVAEANGVTVDGVFKLARDEAVDAAARYAQMWNIPITRDFLMQLLDAEAMKVSKERVLHEASFADVGVLPQPEQPAWLTKADQVALYTAQRDATLQRELVTAPTSG